MAFNTIPLTVVGRVGNDPTFYPGDNGQVPYAMFRLAMTPRIHDRATGTFRDADTSWFTVKAFNDLARNAAESVRRGEPMVVHGRLKVEEWEGPGGHTRVTAVLEAESIGHDLRWGSSRFIRTVHGRGHGTDGPDGVDGPGVADGPGGADRPGVAHGPGGVDGLDDRDGPDDPDLGDHGRGGSGARAPLDLSGAVELAELDEIDDADDHVPEMVAFGA